VRVLLAQAHGDFFTATSSRWERGGDGSVATAARPERIHVLDVVRGAAVFGILVVNMGFFSTPLEALEWRLSLWPQWWNRLADALIDIVFSGKFLSIFAFLFGYGMVLMQERVEARGQPFVPVYLRRLASLALFGLIHGLFIWFGDILFHYAVVGVLLLALRRLEPRAMLTWAVVLLSLLPSLLLLAELAGAAPQPVPEDVLRARVEAIAAAYATGTHAEIQPLRVQEWRESVANHVTFYSHILGLFLLGAYFAKRRLLHDVAAARDEWWRIAKWTGAGAAALTVIWFVMPDFAYVAGGPVIGLFYVSVLALLMTNPAWQRRLMPLAYVGRMAFTNYIAQSVTCTLIFYGYGLGLYGKVGPLGTTLLAAAIFALQVAASRAWLARHSMGPLERVWRLLTYGPAVARS